MIVALEPLLGWGSRQDLGVHSGSGPCLVHLHAPCRELSVGTLSPCAPLISWFFTLLHVFAPARLISLPNSVHWEVFGVQLSALGALLHPPTGLAVP